MTAAPFFHFQIYCISYYHFLMIYGYIGVSCDLYSDKQTVENQRFEINNFCARQDMKVDG